VFLIVGGGERRDHLLDQVRRLGLDSAVRLLGPRVDVEQLLAASDLFVCPSVWDEALGFVNLEAMAAGLPVVATRMGGIPEAVRDGETGLLVPPRDAAALAAAVKSLLDDPGRREAMGRAGRRWVEQAFSIERTIDITMDLYCELAGAALGRAGGARGQSD
jgi:glycosyltransferase involved in cell wall biosynthesis